MSVRLIKFASNTALKVFGSNFASGFCTNGQPNTSPCTAVTAPITVFATGGSGNYTFSWAHFSGDTFTVNSPNSATTTFTKSSNTPAIHSGIYRCTVSDGNTQVVHDITVTTDHENLL